jgi:putative transposase
VQCGYENHADLVGALNILARGMALVRGDGPDTTDASVGQITAAQIACEVNGARARQQQEPTEATTQGVALV